MSTQPISYYIANPGSGAFAPGAAKFFSNFPANPFWYNSNVFTNNGK
ncbi:hypothetical protein HDF15_002922 [Granulicella mallensis]|uniref:Uncharacterized protein n=1 Tax=Granulicella mallensis TaxID=940614 RepID=A0A7W8EAJ6_9BACT|nr:hypothetical protein [Granulicella mallensis]